MRKWVKYDYDNDVVLDVDKVRLKLYAQEFEEKCKIYWSLSGVSDELYPWYRQFIENALQHRISSPVLDRLPVSGWERAAGYPIEFEKALASFRYALASRPHVYNFLDINEIADIKNSLNYKVENGQPYIFEEVFEDQ